MDDYRDPFLSYPNYKRMMEEETTFKRIESNNEAYLKEINIIRQLKKADIRNILSKLIVINEVYSGYRYLNDIDYHFLIHKVIEEVDLQNNEYRIKLFDWVEQIVRNKDNYEELFNSPNLFPNKMADKLIIKYSDQIKSIESKSEVDNNLKHNVDKVSSLSKDIIIDIA
jgi:hypothetical protein